MGRTVDILRKPELVIAGWNGPIRNGKRLVPVAVRAQGRMFSVQHKLPTLPVPALEQTLDRFLLTIKPTLSEEDYNHALKVVGEFGAPSGPGRELQGLLEERARSTINWLSDWWLHTAYLDYRLPVPIYSNPGIAFPKQDYTDLDGQLRAAAKLISGVMDYKVMIDDQSLPVEELGGRPLCMMQFYKILSSCRIPGTKRDSVVNFPPDMEDPPRHIIIAHNNHFFSMEVYGSDGLPFTTEQIHAQLLGMMERSQHEATPIGILTADNRNSWGKAYSKLAKDKVNRANFEEIQRAIFMVCIDKDMKPTTDYASFIAGQMNHGFGSKGNSGNRWFDKTLQFIVGSNGVMGLNYEHAPAEGPPIISVVDHTLNYLDKEHPVREPVPGMKPPQRLDFQLNHKAEAAIDTAKQGFDAVIADLDMTAYTFDLFGKEFIKTLKMSPDAFIQIAIQLAFHRLYGHSAMTYESGSLRRFQYGRTDTIRSCSLASHAYCKAMLDDSKSAPEKVQALKEAVLAHRKYTNEVINGQGIDRHLMGLKMTAIEHGLNVPDFFMDPIYTSGSHWTLSTSQVPSKHSAVLCFGPVVPDGYGICYNPMPNAINVCVSAWNSSPETDSKKMIDSLSEALKGAQAICTQAQSMESKL